MSRSARRLRKQLSRQKEVDVRFIQNDYDILPQKKTFTLKDLKQIKPLTKTQEEAFYEWYDSDKEGYYNDVVCLTGAAGTGKTMLACYMGLQSILDPNTPFEKIVIVRSAVASREIGHLPGEEDDKISVYKQPYHYLFDKFFSYAKSFKNMEDIGLVQFECTSFLRGVTFDNAIVILDECQDTTAVEFETVLTRLGKNSRMFVVGDIWQNDLGSKSGFNEVLHVLKKTEGVSIVEFGVDDIVRSGFVKNYLVAKHTR